MPRPVRHVVLHEQRGPALNDGTLVSVVVTLFDYGHHITECLESVAKQTHAQLELIVVDDGSRDAGPAAAAAFMIAHAARFERTLLVQHVTNEGLSVARNTGFELATSNTVFVLDADNGLYPRAIARLADALAGGPFGVAYCHVHLTGDACHLGPADVWERERFQRSNYVDAMSLVSKAAWAAVGGYRPMDYGWEDYDLWLRFLDANIAGVFVPEVLCWYRVHQGSMLRRETEPNRPRVMELFSVRYPWLALSDD